jgi:hypothetical protein
MKKTLFLAAAVICAAFLLASCDKLTGGNNSNSGNSNSSTKNDNSKPGDTTASGDSVGVPECDAYIKKYEACLNDKVPAQTRDMMKSSFETQRKAWRDAAKTEQGKASLAAACKQADESAKASMTAYGCSW